MESRKKILQMLERFDLTKHWSLIYTIEAQNDLDNLDNSQRKQVQSVIDRFIQNPLPKSEGGYGNPLHGELAGYFKIRLIDAGIRILYTLKRRKNKMIVVLIGMRRDDEVYEIALERLHKFRERRLRRRK